MSVDQTVPQQVFDAADQAVDQAVPEVNDETKAAAVIVEEFPHKVFVGNIAFSTTEEELKEFFAPAGIVREAKIITRGTRSLGYGFVAFDKHEECEEAVAKLSKKELGGREINVEVAKPQTEPKLRKSRGRRNQRRPKKNESESDDGEIITHAEAGAAEAGGETPEKRRPRKKNRPRRKGPLGEGRRSDAPKRDRRPQGAPSKTSVFVANLPFSMDDEGLLELFKDYKVKTASVVFRKGTGRSKGFGFVELESQAEQLRLLASETKLTAEDRELTIKIALRDEKLNDTSDGETPKEEEEGEGGEEEEEADDSTPDNAEEEKA